MVPGSNLSGTDGGVVAPGTGGGNLQIILRTILSVLLLNSVVIEATQIGGSDLHGVEEDSGSLRLDSLLQQAFANLGDCSLDRGSIVKQRQIEVNQIEVSY
jgi:hypothetical protein